METYQKIDDNNILILTPALDAQGNPIPDENGNPIQNYSAMTLDQVNQNLQSDTNKLTQDTVQLTNDQNVVNQDQAQVDADNAAITIDNARLAAFSQPSLPSTNQSRKAQI